MKVKKYRKNRIQQTILMAIEAIKKKHFVFDIGDWYLTISSDKLYFHLPYKYKEPGNNRVLNGEFKDSID